MRNPLTSLASLVLLGLAACGGDGNPPAATGDTASLDGGDATGPDGGRRAGPDTYVPPECTSATCSTALTLYCATNDCPRSWSDVPLFVGRQCSAAGSRPPDFGPRMNGCGAGGVLYLGDAFQGLIFYFSAVDGSLAAVFGYSDECGGHDACRGGPVDFVPPPSCASPGNPASVFRACSGATYP